MDYGVLCPSLLVATIAVPIALIVRHWRRRSALEAQIAARVVELTALVRERFMVQPCMTCHEFRMRVIDVSPNGRSAQCVCAHCNQRSRAPATTAESADVGERWREFVALVAQYERVTGRRIDCRPDGISEDRWAAFQRAHGVYPHVELDTVPAPLPFERTTRSPIPEAVRSQVWRRDEGQCVECATKENLEFDHIIPVARGGATTVRNLQLLCQHCNASKGARI